LCNAFNGHKHHLCQAIIEPLLNTNTMNNLLYTIAVILVILWAIGFLGYHAGGIVHLLLVLAVIAILIRIIKGEKII
jgi:hypothetical protein